MGCIRTITDFARIGRSDTPIHSSRSKGKFKWKKLNALSFPFCLGVFSNFFILVYLAAFLLVRRFAVVWRTNQQCGHARAPIAV